MKVIKIGAVWCNLCNVMKPRWQEIENELPWLETEFLDFDQNSDKVAVYSPDETKYYSYCWKVSLPPRLLSLQNLPQIPSPYRSFLAPRVLIVLLNERI